MGYRSTLAGVVAAVLLVVTWPVFDQLAGLSVGASSAVAGVLAAAGFGITWRVTRPGFQRVRHLHSADLGPSELRWRIAPQQDDVLVDQAGASAERDRKLSEKPVMQGRLTPRARGVPAMDRVRTLATKDIQFIVDDTGIQVHGKRKTIGGDVWEEYVRIQWSAVTAMGFAIGRHDSIVALYAWAAAGKSYHLVDSKSLDNLQWTQLETLVAEATGGRLTLDVASRYNTKSIWPDL